MTFNKYRTKGAYHYDWYETEDWYRWMVDKCALFCKGDTIDIGCGEGKLVELIHQRGYKATGIDKDKDAISLAFPELDVRQGDIENDIFVYKYDYMSCINVIEHLNKPEVLINFINHNVEKGAIITTIDYQGGALGEDHKFEWTYDEMMDFFKEFNPTGFRYKDTEWIGVEITK